MNSNPLPIQQDHGPTGRFAPSPTGRMHLGNIFTALISWLSVKSKGGRWILRIEDLDPDRSRPEWASLIEDDLHWLGLVPNEGGYDAEGPVGPYRQSLRHDIYQQCLDRLHSLGLVYPCRCTRADLRATSAPHASDGSPAVYPGNCRPKSMPRLSPGPLPDGVAARIWIPGDVSVTWSDRTYGGPFTSCLAHEVGDFVLRRADGAWAYQLAVVADDALMGVTEIVRGSDLMPSVPQQIHLCRLLGFTPPSYAHVPLILNERGIRLSKRDSSLAMDALRARFTPDELLGHLAFLAGIIPTPRPVGPDELLRAWPSSPLASPSSAPPTSITLTHDLS